VRFPGVGGPEDGGDRGAFEHRGPRRLAQSRRRSRSTRWGALVAGWEGWLWEVTPSQ
jgi:hypothetical protein